MHSNPQLELARQFVERTSTSIFLTGKAGTGKTTFLHQLRDRSPKSMIVVAPTGVAAINAGGVTIHSFFQLSFAPYTPFSFDDPERKKFRFSSDKIKIIKNLELLVIDEVSMVRADVLDAMSDVLKRYRSSKKPFGGVQLLMIGDLQQLSPVVDNNEWQILQKFYNSPYFFASRALGELPYQSIELNHIFRQSDPTFIDLLNRVRDNNVDNQTLTILNSRYIPDFNPDQSENYIRLTSHNHVARAINERKMDELPALEHSFEAVIQGKFPEMVYPTDLTLKLKVGAQVMFVKNDPTAEKLFYNGMLGVITAIEDDIIEVTPSSSSDPIAITPLSWENKRYTLDQETNYIVEELEGTFTQYPLKTAWAITIHKSQGLTFERAIIDAADSFSHGQVYVALSRCKSFEGMVLSSPIRAQSIFCDTIVRDFNDTITDNQPSEQLLVDHCRRSEHEKLIKAFDFADTATQLRDLQHILVDKFETTYPELIKAWHEMTPRFGSEIQIPSRKFIDLCQTSDVPEQRIRSGAHYFQQQIEQLLIPLITRSNLEINSKAVKKVYSRIYDRISDNLILKLSVFKKIQGIPEPTVAKTDSLKVEKPPKALKTSSKIHETHTKLSNKQPKTAVAEQEKTRIKPTVSTLELFNKGLSIDQIALEKSVTPNTIERHLEMATSEGLIAPTKLIDPTKLEAINSLLTTITDSEFRLAPIREILGEQYSWFELRIAKIAFLKKL